MTKEQAKKECGLRLYRLFWKDGGSSLACVGQLHDGTRWYAPANWTSKSAKGIACTKWSYVERVEKIRTKEDRE